MLPLNYTLALVPTELGLGDSILLLLNAVRHLMLSSGNPLDFHSEILV